MKCWYTVQQLWNEIEFNLVGVDSQRHQTVVVELTTCQVNDVIVVKKLLQMEHQV